jgi:hypothetical protein
MRLALEEVIPSMSSTQLGSQFPVTVVCFNYLKKRQDNVYFA